MSEKTDKRLMELAFTIADHQARIEMLGSKWAALLTEKLDATELKMLDMIREYMEKHSRGMSSVTAVQDFERLERKIKKLRLSAYQEAYREFKQEGLELSENEQKWAQRVSKELSPEHSGAFVLSNSKELKNGMMNSYINGRKFDEWFTHYSESDFTRIVEAVRIGVTNGITIPELVRQIRGTRENKFQDGIISASTKDAERLARTLCGGIANQAKDQFYRDNDDVVIGVEWLDTLDTRTCTRCGGLSRRRWKTKEPHPVPPLHPNCRCVLIPVTELTDLGEDVSRPMANADFMQLAKEDYEKNHPGKKWEELAYSTRKKYYYQAQRDFEKRTGKPAYSQAPGNMKFKDYFLQLDEKTQRSYLGPERFKLWKSGGLDLEKFIPPFPDRAFTVKELKEMDKRSFRK